MNKKIKYFSSSLPIIIASALIGCKSGTSYGSLGILNVTMAPQPLVVGESGSITATLSGAYNGSTGTGSAIVSFNLNNTSFAVFNPQAVGQESQTSCIISNPTSSNASCSVTIWGTAQTIPSQTVFVTVSAINTAKTTGAINDIIESIEVTN